ncbi:MAG TPA: NAD(P)-binding domain-containing protein, partial [Steroidobacteraceae bacterium]
MLFNRLAILGGGNMGRALIGGLLRKDASPGQIAVGEAQEPVRVVLEKDFGITTSADNASVIADADFVLLAVKPQDLAALLAPLSATLQRKRPLVLSVAAGIRIASLQAWCGAGVPI